MKTPTWTHPIHARGVRSPNFGDGRAGSTELTDRRILHYARLGRYGTEMQEQATKKVVKRRKKLTVKMVLEMLGGR